MHNALVYILLLLFTFICIFDIYIYLYIFIIFVYLHIAYLRFAYNAYYILFHTYMQYYYLVRYSFQLIACGSCASLLLQYIAGNLIYEDASFYSSVLPVTNTSIIHKKKAGNDLIHIEISK